MSTETAARKQFRAAHRLFRVMQRERFAYCGPNTRKAQVAAEEVYALPFAIRQRASEALGPSLDDLVYSLRTRRAFRRAGIEVRL